jgi:cytochrome c-type biogenesis protein CcmH/NrfG
MALGKITEPIAQYQDVLDLDPGNAQSHSNIAQLLARQGRMDRAVEHYQQALSLAPDAPLILMNFAWLRATCAEAAFRNAGEAVRLAETACRETGPQDIRALDVLAAAQAEAGNFKAAAAAAERAEALAQRAGQKDLAARIARRLDLYRNGLPYREPPAGQPGATAP